MSEVEGGRLDTLALRANCFEEHQETEVIWGNETFQRDQDRPIQGAYFHGTEHGSEGFLGAGGQSVPLVGTVTGRWSDTRPQRTPPLPALPDPARRFRGIAGPERRES